MPSQNVRSPILKDEKSDVAHIGVTSEELQRGRKKAREEDYIKEDDDDEEGTQNGGQRKRKRSRKALDKKFQCPQEGCGKSYSRAEHLYRHQLNHSRKQIYYCDFPDCIRDFVRQDLCARHRERHTTKGSNLQRKDNYIPQALVDSIPKVKIQTKNVEIVESTYHQQQQQQQQQPQPTYEPSSAIIQSPTESMGPPRNNPISNDVYPATSFQHPNPPYKTVLHRSNSDSYYGDVNSATQLNRNHPIPYASPQQRQASFSSVDPTGFRPPPPSPITPHPETNPSDAIQWNGQPSLNMAMHNHNSGYNGYPPQYNPMPTIPPTYSHPQNGVYHSQQYYNNAQDYLGRNLPSESMATTIQDESAQNDVAYSVFDENMSGRSPSMLPYAFENWLLNRDQTGSMAQQNQDGMHDLIMDPSMQMSFGAHNIPPQTSMSVNSILEPPPPQKVLISEARRQELIDLIEQRFIDGENSSLTQQRAQLLSGDLNSEGHVLSRQSMQNYIRSYWIHFHDQMPILHRPTFSAETCPNLLLLAVLAIGAANLDKVLEQVVVVTAAVDLANFLAWHLRGKLFDDKDFPPPTNLWILQSLILLECYEKLYSSRSLHERSTIHHATTISLLRRGSALFGGSALDSPAGEDDKQFAVDTGDTSWDRWITNEATKRVAYALFIIDSTHAIMFGHTAVMLAHEMRLNLPCDEGLWTAESGLKVLQELRSQAGKPITFPDGLKRILNKKTVRTNRFGRTALMAGLLNVTFHLGQRDVQVRTLGVIGSAEPSWRISLTHAFDTWEKDWDNDHEPSTVSNSANRHIRDSSHYSATSSSTIDEEHTFESRVVLHHLAHMGMHVDVVQCQIYAKAKRLLGKPITLYDYNSCAKRMKVWAEKASARDAVFYSLKFLGAVLTPDISQGPGSVQQKPPPFRSNIGEYVPRDDYLLNRPWVVYFAALVVWSYGYALDGPLKPSAIPTLGTKEEQVADMRAFLTKVGSVSDPRHLNELAGERNASAGLLCFLSTQFKESRWELMDEAGFLLNNCVHMLCSRDGEGLEGGGVSAAVVEEGGGGRETGRGRGRGAGAG